MHAGAGDQWVLRMDIFIDGKYCFVNSIKEEMCCIELLWRRNHEWLEDSLTLVQALYKPPSTHIVFARAIPNIS